MKMSLWLPVALLIGTAFLLCTAPVIAEPVNEPAPPNQTSVPDEDPAQWSSSGLLAFAGNFASIVGLIVSIWVLLKVSKLSSFYVQKARVPQLLTILKKRNSALSDEMNDRSQDPSVVRPRLAEIDAILVSLRRKLKGDTMKTLRATRRRITNLRQSDVTWEKVDIIHADICGLIEQIGADMRDRDWER